MISESYQRLGACPFGELQMRFGCVAVGECVGMSGSSLFVSLSTKPNLLAAGSCLAPFFFQAHAGPRCGGGVSALFMMRPALDVSPLPQRSPQ